ncbi:CRISPR-associated protein Cas4 [Saccharicrinis sp. GN24d3]|uniref:CRISPR-associated protein Cas4 n=1 Tax=Saccharicrinis sp. GN24d3 TaxID=3458416 RepID=UPI004036B290
MQTTGTHFNYYLICHRKLWLFANDINMEHTSDAVYQGKLIHENSYKQRSERFKEIAIEGIKIDYFDSKNNVVHEIKKSDKKEESHILQVKYYLYVLEQNRINATGLLEYPKLRKTQEVLLTEPDREYIKEAEQEIENIIQAENCPGRISKPKCKNCSYFDFCYANETEL